MAHIIEVVRENEAEARSFLDALYYSDLVSSIGYRLDGQKMRAVAVNWDADEVSELDERIANLINNALCTSEDLDEITAYSRIFPDTIQYNSEQHDY